MTTFTIAFLYIFFVLAAATYAMLKLAKLKGLRSSRGLAVFLLLILSWLVGQACAYVYVPLAAIIPLLLQVAILVGIARIPLLKSLLVACIYTLTVITILTVSFTLAWSWSFKDF